MNELGRAGYLAHAWLPVYRRRVERANKCIADMLARCQQPYVSYSGGKDSTALLWLVAQQRPAISVRILTSGETRVLHSNIDEVLGWWHERFPALDLVEVNVDRVFSPEWETATWDRERKAGRGDITHYLPASGAFDGVFLGLRDEESAARRMANARGRIRRYSDARRDATAGTWVCCPLSDWITDDIGALIVSEDLPLLSAYESGGMEARTTMRLTGDAARQNAVVELRVRDPSGYTRLLQRFPELSQWAG